MVDLVNLFFLIINILFFIFVLARSQDSTDEMKPKKGGGSQDLLGATMGSVSRKL